jgi:crossover junction endodeoxyribonuclease RuvC
MQWNKIIAVDPGYDRVGVAVFAGEVLVHSECFSPKRKVFEQRLEEVHQRIATLIRKHKPRSLALETIYFSKNQKTAIRVAEARGVILLAAAEVGIPVAEYSPQAVKLAVTGSGAAQKDAVIRMVDRLVPLSKKKRLDDEYDAIALGYAHQASSKLFHMRTA